MTGCQDVHKDVEPAGVALGIFLAVGTFLGSLPQYHLLMKNRSSQGLSVLTPALVLTYGTFNLYATLTTKWKTVLSCSHGAGSCLLQLLDAIQQAVSALSLCGILLLLVAFPPNHGVRQRVVAAGTVLALLGLGVVTCIISGRAPCSALSLDFATALTTGAGVVCVVAFAPQLLESWRSRGRGSLSYAYYTIQVVGCLLVVREQISYLHDSWRVWLPTGVALIMQLLILFLGIYFRCARSRAATAPTMSAALLDDRGGGVSR